MTEPMPTYNILLLGPIQSGKSTFLEGIRRYIEPKSIIDDQSIGNGHGPLTKDIILKEFTTDARRMNIDGLQTSLGTSSPCRFQIIDTPGFEDSGDHSEKHAAKILRQLACLGHVDLILLLISRHKPLTHGLLMALMAYSNFFSAMRGVMALVHTHVSFRQEVKLKDALQKRRSDIEEVMGVNIPHFSIDCDLHEGQKALKLMQKAAIGSIMHQAISNNPLYLDSVQVNKSQRMRKVDKMVQKIYEGKIDVIDRWLKDGTTAGNMKVSELDSNIEAANKFLREHDTGDLDLIFETHFTEGSSGCKSLSMRKDILLQVLELDCVIEDMQIEHSGVKVKEVQGGVGSKRWEVRLIRKVNQRGRYSARLYAKRCNKYRSEINELEAKLEGWKRTLEDVFWYQSVQRLITNVALPLEGSNQPVEQLKNQRNDFLTMAACVSRRTLPLQKFIAMAEIGVYEGTHAQCIQKVDEFYSKHALRGEMMTA